MKLRRSIAWARGFSEEITLKAIASAADAVCIDLEDGVPPKRKAESRVKTVHMLQTFDFRGKERIVRVNGFGSDDYEKDMNEVIAVAPPDAIRLPKCERVSDLLLVDQRLRLIEEQHDLPKDSIEIIAMIESPLGVHFAFDIASSCPRVTALSVGMEDLTLEMGVRRRYKDNELDLIYARQRVVLEAKAAGKTAIDSGMLAGDDAAKFKQNFESAQMGFCGRSVYTDEEARDANRAFAPTDEEVRFSRGAAAVYESGAIDEETGSVMFEGKRICLAAYEKARRIVETAELIARKEQDRH